MRLPEIGSFGSPLPHKNRGFTVLKLKEESYSPHLGAGARFPGINKCAG